MPAPVRDRLADEVRKIVQQPDFLSWTVNNGGLVEPMLTRPSLASSIKSKTCSNPWLPPW